MIINYQKFPILKLLEKSYIMNKHNGLSFLECDYNSQLACCIKAFRLLSCRWDSFKQIISGNVFIMTTPFADAMEKSKKSFCKLNPLHILKDASPSDGVLLSTFNKYGIIYSIHKKEEQACFLLFSATNLLSWVQIDLMSGEQQTIFRTNNNLFYNGYDARKFEANEIALCTLFLAFKEYAKVEIEQGKCGKTIQSKILKEKLRNNLPFDVNIMDSTWFTTICRNEGFKVRGHFRLQPKKNDKGEWIKELIYINEFEKHGYHRQAKILNDKSE